MPRRRLQRSRMMRRMTMTTTTMMRTTMMMSLPSPRRRRRQQRARYCCCRDLEQLPQRRWIAGGCKGCKLNCCLHWHTCSALPPPPLLRAQAPAKKVEEDDDEDDDDEVGFTLPESMGVWLINLFSQIYLPLVTDLASWAACPTHRLPCNSS